MYGPVRTVVWQGSAGDRRPYADLTGKPEIIHNGKASWERNTSNLREIMNAPFDIRCLRE